ncbi:MAG: secretin N-terminal domain-containing protein [Rickettsiales bacterium]|jgi:general secretion pathway protein D|nr:secretin N-terminal domain-containing protein [Rickettsiales bacterium]
MMRFSAIGSLLLSALLLTACLPSDEFDGFRLSDPYDRELDLKREDYRNISSDAASEGRKSGNVRTGEPPIPDLAQILAAPRPPKISQSKLVSISVTEDVPLRDVLFELARLANTDIELGNGIEGGINFRATNKPFNEVIERISDLAGLRYSMKGGTLRVERDTPYLKNYSIGFLNVVRSSQSTISVTTDVLSAQSGGGSTGSTSVSNTTGSSSSGGDSGLKTGTTASIDSTAESDLWASMEASIQEILGSAAPGTNSPGAANSAGGGIQSGGSGYVINRQAGVISLNASERQHEIMARYLDALERNASAQVLIEAKLIEVTLLDEFSSGVNWNTALDDYKGTFNFQPADGFSVGNAFSVVSTDGVDPSLTDVVQLTQQFGTTRALASPRLHAINNQQAVLTFAQNKIFFEVQVTGGSSSSGGGTNIQTDPSYTTTRSSIPIGIILSILPSINLKKGEVTLSVRPTLSRQVDFVQDPGTAIAAQQAGIEINNEVPIVEVRELDSIMKLKSGGIMVIGGLMEQGATLQNNGIPLASDIPWVGNAFKSRQENIRNRELIIFIKATIINPAGSYQPADKSIYEKFTNDSRPLEF